VENEVSLKTSADQLMYCINSEIKESGNGTHKDGFALWAQIFCALICDKGGLGGARDPSYLSSLKP
jgi:hypothetical protein